jgi:NADPH-dependent 7-cyano-7-deazaguanine reductase QueF
MSKPAILATPLSARRANLAARPNPARHTDYLVSLEGHIGANAVGVALCYVPDGGILDPEGFAAYLDSLAGESWGGIEEIGAAILADVESELVPRYLRVTVRGAGHPPAPAHAAMFEGRQPGWKNEALLARLA